MKTILAMALLFIAATHTEANANAKPITHSHQSPPPPHHPSPPPPHHPSSPPPHHPSPPPHHPSPPPTRSLPPPPPQLPPTTNLPPPPPQLPPTTNLPPPPLAHCPPGSVCKDPVMKTQSGQQFYFHGTKNADFCLVSDRELHINAHFIGLSGANSNVKHDFTWVQSLGVLFAGNQLYIGARKVAAWDPAQDQLVMVLNSQPVLLPAGAGAVWQSPDLGVSVTRTESANAVAVDVAGYVKLTVFVTPVSAQDDAAHGYGVPFGADCMAHLDVGFQFASLSQQVSGVLGQTYSPSFQMPAGSGAGFIPSMGEKEKYITSGVMAPDCAVSRFNAAASSLLLGEAQSVTCGSAGATGLGMVCRR